MAHYRERKEGHSAEKPAFGEVAKAFGWEWEDEGPEVAEAARAFMQERMQKGVAEGDERVFGGPLVR